MMGQEFAVWMAPDIDALLNDFIQTTESHGAELGDQRCPFGAVLWPSARALWQWLNESEERWQILARRKDDPTVNAIELGSGVGFFAALLGANTRWKVTASDYEPAYADYLHANCLLHKSPQLPFLTLDWIEPAAETLQKNFDLVIACDVFYDDSHLMNVPRIAAELLKPDGTMLLADPERFRFRTALDLLRNHFSSVTLYNTNIDHTPEEAKSTGVVNPKVLSTSVQIVHCQNPLTPSAG